MKGGGGGGFGSSYCRLYSKAMQNILSAIYLVYDYCLTTKIKQIKVLPSEIYPSEHSLFLKIRQYYILQKEGFR